MSKNKTNSVAVTAALLATLAPVAMPLYASTRLAQIERPSDLSVSLSQGSITIARASDCGLVSLQSQQPNRVFGYSVQHHSDINGDGFSDVLVASPPTAGEASGGNVMLVCPETGQPIWQTGGPIGMRSAYLALVVDDQDLDQVPDVIVACYDTNLVPHTWLLNGKSGQTLTVVKQNIYDVVDLLGQGKEIFSPTDLDGSKLVDIDDVLAFSATYSAGTGTSDIIKDGVVDATDLLKIFDDFFASKELIKDKVDAESVTGGLAALVLHPEGTEPWCHHVWLAGATSVSVAALAQPAISTVCTPQAVLILLIEALAAKGYTIGQIVAILAGMGFSTVLIAEALGETVAFVEAILARTTHWLYCRNLYKAYKAACAAAGSCGNGPGSASRCEEYRANYLANAVCAIMRSKHMTQCIPADLRGMWDPEGGHGKAIVERWNAAAKCASRFAEACNGDLPPLTPPNIPGLPPMTINPNAAQACTTGAIRYADAAGISCDSYGAEHLTDVPAGPIDWPWVNQELGLP